MDGAWEDSQWPAGTSESPGFRGLLERTEVVQRGAAARLRGMGWEEPARQAEQFAAWARFDLDEPRTARRVYATALGLRPLTGRQLYGKVLEGALSLAGADRGNLQLVHRATGGLVIVAEHGFESEFLEYFAVVDDDHSACGRAAKSRAQTVVADVLADPDFAPHRGIAAASGFRAVLSTPLIDRDGRLIGVVSTHYQRPHRPIERDRQAMRRYGALAGRIVAQHLAGSPPRQTGRRTSGAVRALYRAAHAHSRACEAHEQSVRAGVGDLAEHQRSAEFHRAAAEADRQRAADTESKPVAPAWIDAAQLEATLLESRALRRISQEASARARAARERLGLGGPQWETLREPAFAQLQAGMGAMPVIEQAKGIVMAQQRCSPEVAFDLLDRIAQRTGVEVRWLAAQVVEHVASGGNRGDVSPIALAAMTYPPPGTRAPPPPVEAD